MSPSLFASPAFGLLSDMEREGFRIELDADESVVISPSSRLTPERVRRLAGCRQDLKRLLRCCDEDVVERRDAFRRQLDATPAPEVPCFSFKPDVPYAPGLCFACGDALPDLRFGRCWRCALAWRLVCRVPIPAGLARAIDEAKYVG